MQQPKFAAVLYRGSYYARWMANGEIQRRSLRTKNHREAEAALIEFAAAYEIASRPDKITIEFVWNGYRESLGTKPSATTMGFEWKAVGAYFGEMGAESITEANCLIYQKRRADAGRSDGTARTELMHLRCALLWAEKKGIIGKAPAIFFPASPEPRDLRLTKTQSVKFIRACEMPHVRLFAILALTTGARMGAILDLTWDRVDFEHSQIHFENPDRARTSKRRALVPMNKTARAALIEAREGATIGRVIEWAGQPVASVKKGIAAAGRRCGMPWVTPHVFRHSAASIMAADGVSMERIAQVLAHADSRLTERVYARFSPEHLRDAAAALEIDLGAGIDKDGVLPSSVTLLDKTNVARKGNKGRIDTDA